MFAGSETKPPGASIWPVRRSSLSPIPTRSAPESTVTRSVMLCQCDGMLYLAGNLRRSVTAPFSEGLPSRTLISARAAGRAERAPLHLVGGHQYVRGLGDGWRDRERQGKREGRELDGCTTCSSHKLPPEQNSG